MLRGAVVATALTLAYFGVVTVVTVTGIQGYTPQRAPDVAVTDVSMGPYRVAVQCQSPCRPAEGATFVARFGGEGLPNVASLTLAPSRGESVSLTGPARAPRATVTATSGDTLRLQAAQHDGTLHTARFAAPPATSPTVAGPAWPDTAPGVWWVVGLFTVATAACVIGWLMLVVRAFRAKRRKLQAKAQRPSPSGPPPGATLPPGMSSQPSAASSS
jgi:hypothetical protein